MAKLTLLCKLDVPDMLRLITDHFSKLPPWIRLIITSRDEEMIKKRLYTKYNPTELKCDEERNREDVRAYLEHVVRRNVAAEEVAPRDLEREVQREFGFDMKGEMEKLAPLITRSKEIYEEALAAGSKGDEGGLLKVVEEIDQVKPPNLVQEFDEFEILYADAAEAQDVLLDAFADAWESTDNGLLHPVAGKAKPWIEDAISPGRKSEESARRKMRDNYDGHPNKLTDLARIS